MNKTVESEQAQAVAEIYGDKDAPAHQSPGRPTGGLIEAIRGYSVDVARIAFGEQGVKLKALSEQIDTTHPDLYEAFGEMFFGHCAGTFSFQGCQQLKLAEFANQYVSCPTIKSHIHSLIPNKSLDYIRINDPSEGPSLVRFVADKSARDTLRKAVPVRPIPMEQFYSKGDGHWRGHAAGFASHIRNRSPYQAQIDEGKERAKHFLRHGLTCMAQEIQNTIDQLGVISSRGTYHGFNSLSPATAACHLANLTGFTYLKDMTQSADRSCRVAADQNCFAPYKFCKNPETTFTYRPKLYPVPRWTGNTPSGMAKLIDHLEAFPKLGGKPLFDHYLILVPTVFYPPPSSSELMDVTMPDGKVVLFSDYADAQAAFDAALVDSGAVAAVLLGERNGCHFFISYWL